MSEKFGTMIKARRAELRLSLRDFALRADMDAGNVSRLERGLSSPPQDAEVLNRIVSALEWSGAADAIHLKDSASIENRMLPPDIAENEKIMSSLPLLLRTVGNSQLDDAAIERLIELIKRS